MFCQETIATAIHRHSLTKKIAATAKQKNNFPININDFMDVKKTHTENAKTT